MTALCAFETWSDVSCRCEADIADRRLYVAIGRKVGLQESPREGPESAPKPPPQCEREIGFTRQFRESREASCPNDRTPDRIAAGLEEQRQGQVLWAVQTASRRPPRDKDRPNTG
jgi:hypothetical protein